MPRGKLTKDDWIEAGLNTLVKKSIDSVRVELMAKQFKVTRGSFYWHFESRQDWLNQILGRWRETATKTVIQRFDYECMSAADILNQLATLPYHGDSAQRAADIELAIRAWARRDESARRFVDEVDEERMHFLTELFRRISHSVEDAGSKAFIFYSLLLSESLIKYDKDIYEKSNRIQYIIDQVLTQ